MRFVVIGAGGVGGYLGARLWQAGHEVAYLARGRSLSVLREEGLTVRSPSGDVRTGPLRAAESAAALEVPDAVIVAVKLYDLEALAAGLAPLVGSDTTVLPLQNGVEAHPILAAGLRPDSVLKGTVSVKSVLQAPGLIDCKSGFCRIRLAEADSRPSQRAERLAEALDACAGVEAKLSVDIDADLWRKFVMLASFSAVACLGHATIGDIRDDPDARALVLEAAAEAARVGRRRGIALPAEVAEMTLEQVKDMPPEGRASMLEDLLAGRRLELAWLSGAVVRFGRLSGVPTPIHETACRALAMHAKGRPGTRHQRLGRDCNAGGMSVEKETFQLGKLSQVIDEKRAPISAVTKGAGLVFVSGLPPFDLETGQLVRGDIRVQTRQCLENLKAALETAGTSLEKVLKVTVLASNCAYWDDVNAIYAEYFTAEPPARSFVTVGSWAQPFDIEMEAIALA